MSFVLILAVYNLKEANPSFSLHLSCVNSLATVYDYLCIPKVGSPRQKLWQKINCTETSIEVGKYNIMQLYKCILR